MGAKNSKTHIEQSPPEDDTHSAWGSDIDESFCGPGKICADEWTPLPSRRSSPFDFDQRHLDPEPVITEQPRIFTMMSRPMSSVGFQEDNSLRRDYDVMTLHEMDPVDLEPPLEPFLAPPVALNRRRKRKRTRKLKMKRKTRNAGSSDIVRNQKKPRGQRYVIRIRRKRIRHDPRYPIIAPPGTRADLKFRKIHSSDLRSGRFAKAVPPSHLKGVKCDPKPHFRYRGVVKVIG